MNKRDTKNLIEYFEKMKLTISKECKSGRHICAVCGSIGHLGNNDSRQIFRQWLLDNKISYIGEL